jgi:transcriptional repressor NrdR
MLPKIVKRDERREDFDRGKLVAGIENACVKRPISAEDIARLVDRIERWLQESGSKEVPSRHVGEKVMDSLTALDTLAAVRFASVFLDFDSTEDYAAFFAALEKESASE